MTIPTTILIVAMTIAAEPAQSHEQNTVYQQLIGKGTDVGDGFMALPSPSMPDGLSVTQEQAKLKEIFGDNLDSFTRQSVVADHIMRTDLVESGGKRVRTADFWCIAYGKLSVVKDKDFLNQLLMPGQDSGDAKGLSAEQLAPRGIKIGPSEQDYVGYGHVNYDLLKKVRLSLTGVGRWSSVGQSVVTAAMLDRKFLEDREFPNQWSPLKLNEAGGLVAGTPQPYMGAGVYMKITQLSSVSGALLIESHMLINEPFEWFQGNNLLGSKLPLIVKDQVKTMRTELGKASR
ncbi:MAG: hypothetical protein R3E01_30260 [Pirellulaceae bacterium]